MNLKIGFMSLPFEIIIDCPFSEFIDPKDERYENKRSLCLANDFEDGKWRLGRFIDFIFDNIGETALNARERKALGEMAHSKLKSAAKKLRITDNDIAGGEISEILLYGIMRHHYNALPIVPKIYYKQNANDYAKGADSVHIVIESPTEFSLWLGEAKFYNGVENSQLDVIVKSVLDTLGTEKIRKENTIIIGLNDINELGLSDELKNNIFKLLNEEISIDKIKPILHIPICLLHECKITQGTSIFDEEYVEKLRLQYINVAQRYFEKQLSLCEKVVTLYSKISFHFILFPIPVKADVVNEFINTAKFYRK